jgi:hypothetical protein
MVYDAVLCSQVLEHLHDPTTFLRKLLSVGNTVIISVPYLWQDESWARCHHVSHNINITTVRRWAGRQVLHLFLSDDGGTFRLIMFFKGIPRHRGGSFIGTSQGGKLNLVLHAESIINCEDLSIPNNAVFAEIE